MTDDTRAQIRAQLEQALGSTDFDGLGILYRGKVRDVYRGRDHLILITTDRVSAFDHVLGTIPFKGEILNAFTLDGLARTRDVVSNHLLEAPDPNVIIGRRCRPYPIEFVMRAYITGSLWRDYEQGTAEAYGIRLPAGLRKDQRLDRPVLTPTTKAEPGAHDEPISAEQIVRRGLLSRGALARATEVAHALFTLGCTYAEERGLILVDTKYELGEDVNGRLTLLDEVHTPDSSRFWIAADYPERFSAGRPQNMLDKENLRSWLQEEQGFSGDGTPPTLDDRIRTTLCLRYMEAHAILLGRPFVPKSGDVKTRIETNLRRAGRLA